MARLRVLHVVESFGGGVFEMIRLVAERSAAEGHAAAIAFGRRPETPEDPRAEIDPVVELLPLDWQRRSPRTHVSAALRLRALQREWRPDVVHLHSSFAGVAGALALAGRVPLVFTPHAFASEVSTTARIRRAAFRAAEHFVVRRCEVTGAVSNSEAAVAARLGARRTVVVPIGIPELDGPPARRAQAGPARVIASGRITAQRQPEACARILAAVSDVADVAWIGGGGDQGPLGRAALVALERAGIPVSGWMPRPAVLSELARSTAYLHWTSWDGQSLSVLEAMATGALVVASDIAPNRELLDPRQLCRSEADAIDLLRRVLSDIGFAGELRAGQAERASSHSADAMVAGWLAVYAQVARLEGT
jgi:glycosyltransferase involved in cell wall biosynthesis